MLLVVERPAGERTDGCGWSPADGESNFPNGSEVFALNDGTYVVKLTQGYFVLQRE